MAQLRLLPCSPSPSTLSLSANPPCNLLFTASPLHSCNSSVSLSSLQPSLCSLPSRFSLLRRPASAVAVHGEQTSVETESEIEEISSTRVLAQNVPWSSTADDIRSLFQKYGTVLDVELSMHNRKRNRGLAFVEMGSPEEASEALTKLDSYEFEGRVLKLNYAKPRTKKPSLAIQPKRAIFELFVGNLSYEVRSEDLIEFFTSGGYNVVSARVVIKKADPEKSVGYGFVAFATKEEANAALSACEGKELLGREIHLERCIRFKRKVIVESEDMANGSNPIVDQVEESNDS